MQWTLLLFPAISYNLYSLLVCISPYSEHTQVRPLKTKLWDVFLCHGLIVRQDMCVRCILPEEGGCLNSEGLRGLSQHSEPSGHVGSRQALGKHARRAGGRNPPTFNPMHHCARTGPTQWNISFTLAACQNPVFEWPLLFCSLCTLLLLLQLSHSNRWDKTWSDWLIN